MGSNMKLLPLINFSNVKKDTPTWESVKNQVREALEEYNCFEVTFDQIPLRLTKSVVDGLKLFFDLPLETKLRNTSENPFHGYLGPRAPISLYESLGIEDVLSPGKVDAFANLMWPQARVYDVISKNVHCFAEQLHELDKIVRAMVVEILGLEKYMDEHLDSTDYVVRAQKYDVPRSSKTELGLMAHTDKNVVTILYQSAERLQVEAKDGLWITVGASLNSFLVNIGDALHAWTNGHVQATNHRVIMSGDEARYSIGLFSMSKSGYIIKAPEEMVDEDNPLLYKPYEHFQYLEFCNSDKTRPDPLLKAYCGA